MKGFINHVIIALKGFGMGAANIVPGVSGGTIALLTGIYGDFIDSLNQLMILSNWKMIIKGKFKDFWKNVNGGFLTALFIGILLSLISLAKLMEYVIVYHPVQTWAFFFGLIIASAIYMLFDIKGWKLGDVLFLIVGGISGILVCTMSPTQTPDDLWFIFICGAIAICTMILPGISGSFILVILSKYEYIINALNTMNLPVLLVFVFGCVVGILAFAKFLHWLLAKYERQTMLILIGFVIGSLVKVWPWNDMEAVAKAHFLHLEGFNAESATSAVTAIVEQGGNLKSVANMHVTGAIVWAIIGLSLVWILETIGRKVSSSIEPLEQKQ